MKFSATLIFLFFVLSNTSAQLLRYETRIIGTSLPVVLENAAQQKVIKDAKIKNSSKDYSLKFIGLNSSITTNKLKNPGLIKISHAIPRKDDDLVFSIYYSSDGEDWKKIEVLQEGLSFKSEINTDTILTTKNYSIDLVGDYHIKFIVDKYNSGFFQIESLEIFETSPDVIRSVNERTQKGKEFDKQIDQIKKELSSEETESQIKYLNNRYLKQIGNYELLIDKTNSINILYNLVLFTYDRAKMVSPTEYTDFKNILKGLMERADVLDSIMVMQLQESLKTPPLPKGNTISILKIGYNIGNIISGGKLDGVINSFKSIFARTYSTTNLLIDEMQKKQPGSTPIFEKISRQGGNVTLDQKELQRIKAITTSSVKDFQKMSNFFSIIKDEHNHLEELMNNLRTSSTYFEGYQKALRTHIKIAYKAIDFEITDFLIDSLGVSDPKTKVQLTQKTNDYFKNLTLNFNQNKDKLDLIYSSLRKFEEIEQDYYIRINDLINIVSIFRTDIARPNPFSNTAEFKDSSKKWAELSENAKNKIESTPNQIIATYIKSVRNRIEK